MNQLTPEQYIKKAILLEAQKGNEDIEFYFEDELDEDIIGTSCALISSNIDELYEELKAEFDDIYDAEEEFRCSGVATDLPSQVMNHYDCEEVGQHVGDGIWVGYTYWFGGGKHGEPESIPWMEDAYFLDVKEEEKLVIVRTFNKM